MTNNLLSSNIHVNKPASKKLVTSRELMDVDWTTTNVYTEYALLGKDRNYKFKEQLQGTLTMAQLQNLSMIQITVQNKSQIALQIKQTAEVILEELVPVSELFNIELLKFLNQNSQSI